MIYTATITTAALRLRESRIVADLLLQGVDDEGWHEAIVDNNMLQIRSSVSIPRISRLLRARLEPLGQPLWKMVRDGDAALANQATLAGAIHNSRLLGDFMDIALREQRDLFATRLEHRVWRDYIDACRGRDPDMPLWSESTVNKLRSVVFAILAEAGYLSDTTSLTLQTVFVDIGLAAHLRDLGEKYVLRCLEVME